MKSESTDFSEIIRQAERAIGHLEVTKMLGISKRTLYNWKTGRTEPPASKRPFVRQQLQKILGGMETFVKNPEVPNTDPLSGGYKGHIDSQSQKSYVPVHIVRPILSDNGVQLEFVAEENAEFYVEQRYFIASYHDKPDHYYSYQMVGSAMAPTINPGETVLMRPWRDRPIIHDGVYLLTGIHGLAVRRLGFSGDHVTVKGDNPEVEPSSYTLEQFGETFTVHMICRSVRKML